MFVLHAAASKRISIHYTLNDRLLDYLFVVVQSFCSVVVPILGNYALIQRKLAAAREKGEPVGAAEEEKLWTEAHEWGSERLASTIMDLKGFYVKRYVRLLSSESIPHTGRRPPLVHPPWLDRYQGNPFPHLRASTHRTCVCVRVCV